VIVSIATTAAAESLWHEWRIVNAPHAGMEALGALGGHHRLFPLEGEEVRGARRLLAAGFPAWDPDVFARSPRRVRHSSAVQRRSLVAELLALVWLPGRWVGRQRLAEWLRRGCGCAIRSSLGAAALNLP
jgi:hypothetical protein